MSNLNKGKPMSEYESFSSYAREGGGRGSHGKTGKYDYIGNGHSFFDDGHSTNVSDLIRLCKICFAENQTFRNSILTLVQLSNSSLLVRGENESVVNFYKAWLKKINIWQFCNEFFTEWYRSGNLFIFRAAGDLKLGEVRKLTAQAREELAKNRKVGIKYVILDPQSINNCGASNLLNSHYSKVLTRYEIERLRNPTTPQDIEFLNSLSPENRKSIEAGSAPFIKLNSENLIAIFNNKQPYETFAVPTFSPIIKQINLKNLMLTSDTLLYDTIDLVVLHIQTGYEGGVNTGYNKALVAGMTQMMTARGANRSLITDFSTNIKFVLPDLTSVMPPDRYKDIDRDISAGLMDLFSLSDNFSSSYVKTRIYLELLNQGRDAFLTQFLIPEMEKIAQELGFDSIPEVEFQKVSLESDVEEMKQFIKLYELGVITPEGLKESLETKQLPLVDDSGQIAFKAQKDKGLYEPIAPKTMSNENGRPVGAKKTQTKKAIKRPAGSAAFDGLTSLEKWKSNMPKMDAVFNSVESSYKQKNNLQRLTKKHKMISDSVATNIIASEPMADWADSVSDYLENPFGSIMTAQKEQIMEIASEYEVPLVSAAIFYHGLDFTNE